MPSQWLDDEYTSGEYHYWHLSVPSPELESAIERGWIPRHGRVLDVGCGAGTEVGYLVRCGADAVGVDLSMAALRIASRTVPNGRLIQADVLHLPFSSASFDAAIDRGCFHYLDARDRPRYVAELARIVRPGGRFLLRASLRSHGVRNGIDENRIRRVFEGWPIALMEREAIPTDERTLDALVVHMARPDEARQIRSMTRATRHGMS
jgi:SAM-dependent methyltransferase